MKKFFVLMLGAMIALSATAQRQYTLPQLLDSARQHNFAIRSARHDIEAAELQRKEAFTKYFPNVSGNLLWFNANKGLVETSLDLTEKIPPQITATLSQVLPAEMMATLTNPITFSMMKNGTIASLMAVQPVFAGGQIINGNKLAKLGEDVSRLQLRLSENEVEKTAEQYYWQMVTMQEKVKTIDAVEALLNDIHKDVDVAVRAGLAMRNDLLQVELRQNEVASQRLKLMNGLSLVRMVLSQHCGLRDTTFLISYEPEATLPLAVKQDHQLALANTTEYKLLGKQVEATELQRKMTFGQNLPTVAVGI